ncbi:MAG: Bro-N domain-containing protein [Candidatus Moranbacteria bacterium]|nr:Bro-N domain-containing protein [Candidatus Moranbacteria bacterium]
MKKEKHLAIFDGKKIRRDWNEKEERWYFSVVDIVEVLTDSVNPRDYWFKMKKRVKSEDGVELSTICRQLKMRSTDGKYYLTDAADTEAIFRIIQSVPSPKAEPFKRWLARVGYERIEEINDPERALNRSREYWRRMGRSEKWIQQRMMGQEVRNKLTDYWRDHEVTEQEEYAILTNIIHEEWSDFTVKEHKKLKKLKTENLRDHMSDAELIFTALAELSTRQIAEVEQSRGFQENKIPAKRGGRIAKRARIDLENKTGRKVVTGENFKLPSSQKKLIK